MARHGRAFPIAQPTGQDATRKILFPAPSSAALTGTATTATEAGIVTGGKTIILTLTGDTWVAAGATFDIERQNILNVLDSAQAEANGWDAVVKTLQGVAGVVRTSATIVTITLDAQATYSITANETITASIPATALIGAAAIVASPTFTVTNSVTHATSGVLVGPGSTVVGAAELTGAGGVISRKYPRRGRSRPRKTQDVVISDIPKIVNAISAEREEIAQELAEAQALLVSSKLMADNGVNRTEKIKKLGRAIEGLESDLRMKREEEELFLMLTLMVLEN